MALNPQQRCIVEALDGAVNVAAGAGTGKTYTLTQRIVTCVKRALDDPSYSGDPMQCVLAITFTDKAAEELRSRVRSALLDEAAKSGDMRLRRCALDVDNAWISTIHAMASRILRENALDLGIDPSFETLSNDGSNAIFESSLNEVLERARLDEDPAIKALLSKLPISSYGPNSYSLISMINKIASHAEFMPMGFEGVDIAVATSSPACLLRRMVEASSPILDILRHGDWSASDEKNRSSYLDELEQALSGVEKAFSCGMPDSFYDEGFDVAGYLDLVFSFPPTSNKFPSRTKEHLQGFSDYRAVYKSVAEEVMVSVGSIRLRALIDLTKRVYESVESKKNGDRILLSQSDLLRICNDRLADPSNEGIVERYRQRFAYIMIDEFQDTDKLQMSLIGKLARKGEATGHAGLINVCTVGDMQQSIYRFRGGDVTLAKERSEALSGIEGARFELTSNYRSHGDILDCVEMVFSQQGSFGDDFLKLEARSTGLDEAVAAAYERKPRVQYDLLHYSSKREVSSDAARIISASRIAAHFKELIDSGIPANKLAILLGKTSGADIYQRALSIFGIESVVVKGSIFSKTEEALLVRDILDHAANTDQEQCLFRVLSSRLFNVSDDDLLELSTKRTEDGWSSRPLSKGFRELVSAIERDDDKILDRYSQGMIHAAKVIGSFVSEARSGSVSRALRDMLLRSGSLFRLEMSKASNGRVDASSISIAANLNKAIGIVKKLESGSSGIVGVAFGYSSYLDTENVTPGTLSVGDSDFVQIITVHSSKGLEYDHVAIADLKDGMTKSTRFVVENCGDRTYVAMRALDSEFGDPLRAKAAGKVLSFTSEDEEVASLAVDVVKAFSSNDPGRSFASLSEYSKQQDLEEARRLLYVAMTRAKETLYLSHICSSELDKPYAGIYHDIETALDAHFNLDANSKAEETNMVQMPIRYMRRRLSGDSLQDDELDAIMQIEGAHSSDPVDPSDVASGDASNGEHGLRSASGSFLIPKYQDPPEVDLARFDIWREDVHSYTSLSKLIDHPEPPSNVRSVEGGIGHPVTTSDIDDGPEPFIGSMPDDPLDALVARSDDDKATDLGTAFHRLAQLAIIESEGSSDHVLVKPSPDRIMAQIASCTLSEVQSARLEHALNLWFGSDECRRLSQHGSMAAEVPFSVRMEAEGVDFILEGEMDALSIAEDGRCLLIDYKTGGSDLESEDDLRAKHLLQSQCYSYALLANGMSSVEAHFVRVERPVGDTDEPQIVKYSYGRDDLDMLHDVIIDAYRYPLGDHE